jgi:hypothetical protein
VLGIPSVQRLFNEKIVVKSGDHARTKVILDTLPKVPVDGMAFRCTNPEVIVAVPSRWEID